MARDLVFGLAVDAGQFNRGLAGAQASLAKFSASAAKVGAGLAAGVVAGLGAAAVASVKFAADFDQAMTKSLAIMGNVSKSLREDMAKAALAASRDFNIAAEKSAESFFFLASAGLSAEESIAALPKVAAFAKAGMFDMAQATDLLTDAQSALGLTIRGDTVANMQEMQRVSDVLVKANTLANASVEQFATALTTKAGTAMKTFGIDVEEGVAVLAALADQGIKAQEAGTQFSIVLRNMTTQAVENADAFKAMGIEVFDSAGDLNSMADIIGDLEGALAGMSDESKKAALMQLGFADRAQGTLLSVIGLSDGIRRYEEQLRVAGGTTEMVAAKQMQTFNEQVGLLQKDLEALAITVGSKALPALTQFIMLFREGIGGFFSELVSGANDLAAVFERSLLPAAQKFADIMGGMQNVKTAAGGAAGGIMSGVLGALPGGGMLKGLMGMSARGAQSQRNNDLMSQMLNPEPIARAVAQGMDEGTTKAFQPVEQEMSKLEKAIEALKESIENQTVSEAAKLGIGGQFASADGFARDLSDGLADSLGASLGGVGMFGAGGVPSDLSAMGLLDETDEMQAAFDSLGGTLAGAGGVISTTRDWSKEIQNLSAAFSLFGDPGKQFGAIATGILSISQSIGGMKGGGLLDKITGGLGIAGAGLGIAQGIGGLVGGLFGGGEEAEVNDMRDAFFEAQGGWLQLQQSLASATDQDLVARIFDAQTVQEFEAAVRSVNSAFDTQAQAQQALEDAVQRYGFSIEELGPKFQQQELDAMAGQLIQDFQILTASGIEQATVLERMGPAMSEYVQTALAAGAAIPESMRAQIEAMIEMGALVDENGNAFESIEQSGLQFTESLSEGLGRVIESIDALVAALTGDFPAVNIPVNFDTGGGPDISGFRPGAAPGGGPPISAAGGYYNPEMGRGPLPAGGTPLIAHPGEEVSITPAERGVSVGGITVNMTVSGVNDPKALADKVAVAIERNLSSKLVSSLGRVG